MIMTAPSTNTRPAVDKVIARGYAEKQRHAIRAVCLDCKRLAALPVNEFMDLLPA